MVSDIINGLLDKENYIPFENVKDGCSGRSLYIRMELAAQQIPSSEVEVIGTFKPEILSGDGWQNHYAALIKVQNTAEPLMLDLPFSREPIPLNDWIKKSTL
jgi:hypothetical protein